MLDRQEVLLVGTRQVLVEDVDWDIEAYRALGDHTVGRLLTGEPVTHDASWWKVWA